MCKTFSNGSLSSPFKNPLDRVSCAKPSTGRFCYFPDLLLGKRISSSAELTGEVLSVMRDLANEGMTMLVVTHEMGFARTVSNKVIFMEDGVIVEQGSSKEFFENPKEERTKAFLRTIQGDMD